MKIYTCYVNSTLPQCILFLIALLLQSCNHKGPFPLSVCGSVKIQMGSVPIFMGAGASPLKSIETKFSVNAPAPANAQWKQSLSI